MVLTDKEILQLIENGVYGYPTTPIKSRYLAPRLLLRIREEEQRRNRRKQTEE